MSPITFVHDIINRALEFVKLVQNREIGWQTVDRKTGQYKREQQPILKKLKLLFLFSPVMTWLDQTHLL
jgi:phosphatidylserine decarboxylase